MDCIRVMRERKEFMVVLVIGLIFNYLFFFRKILVRKFLEENCMKYLYKLVMK